jgi:secreted PhoX family phosphatase
MAKDFTQMEDSNRSSNPSIHDISQPERRMFLGGSGALALSMLLPACAQTPVAQAAALSFKPIPIGTKDDIVVPEGYRAHALAPWGEPVGIAGNMPAFKMDGSNTAADQAVQMGMHHDGLHYYSVEGSKRGLLVMNHEYVDDGLLHTGGMKDWSAEKVRKSQAAHGISVIEVQDAGRDWQMVRPSRFARRITATTPFSIGGP